MNPIATAGLVDRFSRKLEMLKGHAHRASGPGEAAGIVAGVCRDGGATCVALGRLEPGYRETISVACEEAGMEVLAPPYAFADLPGAIDRANVGVAAADFGIAETGTLAEVALDDSLRLVSALPRTYIGIVKASDLIDRLQDSASHLRAIFQDNPRNCTVSFISGPSRTGDIELILTLGVHGPGEVHVIIIEDTGDAHA